jgi:hypothetical protein
LGIFAVPALLPDEEGASAARFLRKDDFFGVVLTLSE